VTAIPTVDSFSEPGFHSYRASLWLGAEGGHSAPRNCDLISFHITLSMFLPPRQRQDRYCAFQPRRESCRLRHLRAMGQRHPGRPDRICGLTYNASLRRKSKLQVLGRRLLNERWLDGVRVQNSFPFHSHGSLTPYSTSGGTASGSCSLVSVTCPSLPGV
jgi:hypothetical protein